MAGKLQAYARKPKILSFEVSTALQRKFTYKAGVAMIAKMQRLIVISLLLTAAVWLSAALASGRPLLGVAGASLSILSYAAFLAVEMLLVLRMSVSDSESKPTQHDLTRAWWGEVKASAHVFFWRQPFRYAAEPDELPSMPNESRGVLLVHGFVCNRAFWNPWMTQLRRAGISFIAVDLEPPFTSISRHAAVIGNAVTRLTVATGVPPLVIAHSMGGLAVRHWLAEDKTPERVYRVITIGTPHRGTWLARFSRRVPGTEMAIDSSWLRRLAQRSDPSANSLFTCFYGNADNVVFPASLARLPGADNRLIRAVGHVRMAFQREVFDEAMRCLRATEATAF